MMCVIALRPAVFECRDSLYERRISSTCCSGMSVPLSGAAIAAGSAAELIFFCVCAIALRLEQAEYTVGSATVQVALEFCKLLI